MRHLAKVLCLFVILVAAPAAFSQVLGDEVQSMEGISDGCGSTMNPDECMSSGSWTTTICSNEACPACGFDQTMTRSVCYRLYGNIGYCSCQGGGVGRDRYGNKVAQCNTNGSCSLRR